MGMRLFLLAACILGCMNQINCEASKRKSPPAGESTSRFLGSLFGYKPCIDESCDYEIDGSHVSEATVTSENVPSEDDYEPQEHDVEYPSDNPTVHCLILRPSAVKAFGILESRHPGISEIKYKILEEIIAYASAVSSFRSENCSSEIKLLDFVIFSANELRQQYSKLTTDNCNYTIVDESEYEVAPKATGTKSPEYVSTGNSTPCPEGTKEPEVTTPKSRPTEKTTEKPCPEETSTTEKPCPEKPSENEQTEEIIAEDVEYNDQPPPFVGSIRGIPGFHYPNYSDVPITSFSCADKYIPGFYADLETGCQVFHVCYEHRRESFLCPVGTIFNQPILACDYWYSSNCSLAPVYYEENAKTDTKEEEVSVIVDDFISTVIDGKDVSDSTVSKTEEDVLDDIAKFLPVKAKVIEFPESSKDKVVKEKPQVQDVEDIASDIFDKIITTATGVTSKTRDAVLKIPAPIKPVQFKHKPIQPPIFKVKPISIKAPLIKTTVAVAKAKFAAAIPATKVAAIKASIPVAKAKMVLPIVAAKTKVAAAAIPAVKIAAIPAVKIAAMKSAVPIVAKAKIAGAALPIVAAKAKVAAAVPAAKVVAVKAAAPVVTKAKAAAAAVPIAAKVKFAGVVPKVVAKASIPALKTKMIASALPLAKAKIATPVLKGKALAAAGVPIMKAKMIAAPLLKAKVVKAAAISPLTKKALALGYMKLLKAKKLALMG